MKYDLSDDIFTIYEEEEIYNELDEKTITEFRNAKDTIAREVLFKIANSLNIHYKEDTKKISR